MPLRNSDIFSFKFAGVFINSLISFLSAFLLLKIFVGFIRYSLLKAFGGTAKIINFQVIAIEGPYSKIWTYLSVYLIYGLGIILCILIFFIAKILLNKYYKHKGGLKIFLIWIKIIALHQSLVLIFTGTVLKQDHSFIHVLEWMYIPYVVMIIIGVLCLLIFGLNIYLNFFRLLVFSPSVNFIDDIKSKKIFYLVNYIFVIIVGYIVLIAINFPHIYMYEIFEAGFLLIPFIIGLVRDRELPVSIPKNDKTYKIDLLLILFFTFLMLILFWIKWR